MKRRSLLSISGIWLVGALVLPRATEAQRVAKQYRIGCLALIAGFRDARQLAARLRELGFVEGQNLAIEYRHWFHQPEKIPEMARELVRMRVDVIVAGGSIAIDAAINATSTIPIVMIYAGDPVAMGFAASLSRPGGNVTGLAWDFDAEQFTAKHAELFKETLPGATTVGMLWNVDDRAHQIYKERLERAVTSLGLRVVSLGIRGGDDIPDAFRRAKKERADGLIVFLDYMIGDNQKQIIAHADAQSLPLQTIGHGFGFNTALVSYGPRNEGHARRAADYVGRILRGEKPGDLAIQQPNKFDIVVNLKAAKALGLTVPRSMLLRADVVLE